MDLATPDFRWSLTTGIACDCFAITDVHALGVVANPASAYVPSPESLRNCFLITDKLRDVDLERRVISRAQDMIHLEELKTRRCVDNLIRVAEKNLPSFFDVVRQTILAERG